MPCINATVQACEFDNGTVASLGSYMQALVATSASVGAFNAMRSGVCILECREEYVYGTLATSKTSSLDLLGSKCRASGSPFWNMPLPELIGEDPVLATIRVSWFALLTP
mmetsp:Transcript_2819/g.10270  ORF Transcript_2819/g.10270 Transcript_2819/m.10270 type:complete len:110 (+) Transcript_2819:1345-1674(+)